MNKQQVRSTTKQSHKKISDRGYSLHHLQYLNAKLDNERQVSKKMLDKIKQEQTISNKFNDVVNTTIVKIESQGVNFAAKIEEEKRKNQALTALVSHYQDLIYNQKKQNPNEQSKTKRLSKSPLLGTNITFYQPQKQHSPSSNLPSQQAHQSKNLECAQKIKQLKELQKEYDQFVLKANNSEYELFKKLDEVNTLRSERTVLNKVFDQFELEIFQHQLLYKQLVIQRAVLQSQFQEEVKEFEQLNHEAEKQYGKYRQNLRKKTQNSRVLDQLLSTKRQNNEKKIESQTRNQKQQKNENSQPNQIRNTFTSNNTQNGQKTQIIRFSLRQDKQVRQHSPRSRFRQTSDRRQYMKHGYSRSIFSKSMDAEHNLNKSQKQLQKLKYQKQVKQVYQDLQIKNVNQIPYMIQNMDKNVQDLFKQSEYLYDILYHKEIKYNGMFKNLDKKRKKQPYLCIGDVGSQTEDSRKMQSVVKANQELRTQIHQVEDQNQCCAKQIINFGQNQLGKLSSFCYHDKNPFLHQGMLDQDLYNIEQISDKMSQIQSQILNLPCLSTVNEATLNQISIINKLSSQRQTTQGCQKNVAYLRNTSYTVANASMQKGTPSNTKNVRNLSKMDKNSQNGDESSRFGQQVQAKTSKQWRNNGKQSMSEAQRGVICEKQSGQNEFDYNRLQMLLKANRTTHNNTTIFTEQQLIKISRFKLQNSRLSQAQVNKLLSQDERRKVQKQQQKVMKKQQQNQATRIQFYKLSPNDKDNDKDNENEN